MRQVHGRAASQQQVPRLLQVVVAKDQVIQAAWVTWLVLEQTAESAIGRGRGDAIVSVINVLDKPHGFPFCPAAVCGRLLERNCGSGVLSESHDGGRASSI